MAGSPLDALGLTSVGCNAWNEGQEIQTDIGVAPKKITVQNSLASQSGCMNNPLTASKTTTLSDTNQVSKTSYSYDIYGNVTDEKDYDWGNGAAGSLLREITWSYVSGAQYTAPTVNLLRLPSYRTVSLNNISYAATAFTYDGSSLQDAAGIVGHDSSYGTGLSVRGNLTSVSSLVSGGNQRY